MPEIQIAGVILTMLGVAAWWLTTEGNKEKKQNEENKRGCCWNCYHEEHKDCYCLECRCKNEVCTELRKKYWQKRRAMMAALVVGQDVYVVSNDGRDFLQGKVTEVTPKTVTVLTAPHGLSVDTLSQHYYDLNLQNWGEPFWFDNEGKNGTDGHEGMNVWGFDWYPWHIDDMPFAERRRGHV